jgi:hypothetical protein
MLFQIRKNYSALKQLPLLAETKENLSRDTSVRTQLMDELPRSGTPVRMLQLAYAHIDAEPLDYFAVETAPFVLP